MKKQAVLWTILTMLAFVASPAGAKEDTVEVFVKEAVQGGIFEVEAGNLAVTKATDPEVKKLGEIMVDDHKRINQELIAITQAKNIDVPKETSEKHNDQLKKLKNASGNEFDRTYIDMMVKHHKKDVEKFKEMSGSINDPQLKVWIDKTLPVLQRHLQLAQLLNKPQ